MKNLIAFCTLSLWISLSLAGCSSDVKGPPGSESCESADFTSEACSCDDLVGETACKKGKVVCSCESAISVDDEDEPGEADESDEVAAPKVDAGKKPSPDAAAPKDAGPSAKDVSEPKPDSSTPVAPSGDGGPTGPAPTGDPMEPIIPEPSGECPMFKSGSATISGLRGISLTVGAKKEGTGALLFYWHGTGSSAGEVNSMVPSAARKEITDNGGIIVSFGGSTGSGGDCSGTGTFAKDDFKIADLITACAVKNHGINPKRIYSSGCSAGGLMAGCMGIQRSNYIAAVAPNSGGITVGYGKMQDPARVPAVMLMHGGGGDNVIVNFGQTSTAYANYMMKAGSFAVMCQHSSGHCGSPTALQASAWQFLKDHPFGTKPSPYAGGLPSGFHSTCKLWTPTEEKPLGGG